MYVPPRFCSTSIVLHVFCSTSQAQSSRASEVFVLACMSRVMPLKDATATLNHGYFAKQRCTKSFVHFFAISKRDSDERASASARIDGRCMDSTPSSTACF